jgi:cellulose synthase/poly-beta-1,6-N-acetylglucosamine synthase-like glycosyltransferase
MDYRETPYFHVGRAADLTGSDRLLYRFFEMVPGLLAWGTIIPIILLARFAPVAAAILVIVFDVYWLIKTIYLSVFLRHDWKRLRRHMAEEWHERIERLKCDHLYHAVIFPFYQEPREVIERSLVSVIDNHYDTKKIVMVLAAEARAGDEIVGVARELRERYRERFFDFLVTVHPDTDRTEIAGKGSNIAYSAKLMAGYFRERNIPFKDVLVSALDVDTVVFPEYFACLTWHFLTAAKPYRSSFQPVPLYNNNLWDAPAFSRVVAVSGTFWQMIQQERPERLATFSSHAIPLSTLEEMGYWQRNMVSEDSRIFWNAFAAFNGDYRVVPMTFPVSMDVSVGRNFFETMKNVYKQQRRWAWGSENVAYILMMLVKHKSIPLKRRLYVALVQLEGFWSLATHPLIILLLGWLPIMIGGRDFASTVIAYNLPQITGILMNTALGGLFVSAALSWSLLPRSSIPVAHHKKLFMLLQWALVPFTMLLFSALPAVDAQTRLMLGRYMGFWVTPKIAKAT